MIKEDNKPTLFLDFDETIVDTMKAFCAVYNDWYSSEPDFIMADYTDVQSYDFSDQCTLLESGKDVDDIFNSGDFFNHLEVKDGCLDVLHEYKHRFNYQIITIGSPKNLAHKALWIEDTLPFIQDIVLISNGGNKMDKSIIDMKGSESMPNIFIDDHQDNIESSNCDLKFCVTSHGERDWNKRSDFKIGNWKQIDIMLENYQENILDKLSN